MRVVVSGAGAARMAVLTTGRYGMRWTTGLMLLALPAALAAQEREPAVIQVAGTRSVKTDPDMA